DGPIENDDLIGTDMVTILPLSYDEAQTFWNTTYELEFHTIFVLIIPEDPENETDPDNNEANKDIIINQIPIPLFQAPSSSFEDDTIEFDGSYTVDTQSDLDAGLMFYWNFGDPYGNQSNPSEVSGSNLSRPAHIYTKSGEYNITLRVQDDGGAYDIITAKLIISNIAPIAQFNVSNTIPFEDEIITFDASESWDTAQIELV
ncbi:MAG: PKD domain-containing protein, partial [Thermoplasmata archaeon]|nr:PKD domain-containing protein [Thermoplasmata archaeon]